ncbi:MAG: hypothetical protein ACM3NN_16225 [Nitrospirota bacterium]
MADTKPEILRFAQNDKLFLRFKPLRALPKLFTGVCWDLALSSGMFRGALVLALGLFTVCFPLAAQQPKNSGGLKHRLAAPGMRPLDGVSNLSIYRPNVTSAFNSILFHNGPVRAWSDGAQLVSESAFVQIGMAPLGLFPAAYLAPSDVGPTPVRKSSAAPNYPSGNFATDGKDLPPGMLDSPLNNVYVTGEIGFVYGQWSGKGNGDYIGSYIWGQAGNDKFQITAGGSFENWSGNSPKIRGYQFSR